MIDDASPTGHRCRECGRFCGCVVRYRGPSLSEITSCVNCGIKVPECAHEDGTVSGCSNKATQEGSRKPNLIEKFWCDEHAPAAAEPLPYTEGDS